VLEELIDTLGLPALVLIIVGVALLIVVILLMSYFNAILTIINFTYPNAKLRAIGNPYVKIEEINRLIESTSLNEILSKLRDKDYDLPKEIESGDLTDIERKLEENQVSSIKKAYKSVPSEVKPFMNKWLMRYDIKMVKRAIKGKSRGVEGEKLAERLIPVKEIDEEKIEDIKSARDKGELISIFSDTRFGKVIQGMEDEDDYFKLDIKLDKFLFEELKRAVRKIGSEEKTSIRFFFGNYTDILNLKTIIRGLKEGMDEEILKEALLPSGRELEEWKLNNMIESGSIEEALVELEGTSYDDLKDVGSEDTQFAIEKLLDKKLLKLVSEIYSRKILTIGPLLKYLVAKDMELRNLKIVLRGKVEGLDTDKIKDMLVMEDV